MQAIINHKKVSTKKSSATWSKSCTKNWSDVKNIPSRHLLVQIQQWNCPNNVWNLPKVNNQDTRANRFSFFIVNFEQILHIGQVFPLMILNK